MLNIKDKFQGKRIAAIDYGRKRLGIAVCDELHISIKPLAVLNTESSTFWDDLSAIITNEYISLIVIGIPYRLDNNKTLLIEEIESFIIDLKNKTKLDVIEFDESYSTIRASEIMLQIGKKKKKRRKKGSKDLIAAAVILRDFLDENF